MIDAFYFPTPESHKVAYQVGVLCVIWSGLEQILNGLLVSYLDTKDYRIAETFMANLDFRRKAAIIKPIAFLAETSDRYTQLEKFIDFSDNTLRPERNRYVHDIYRFTPEQSILTTYKTTISKPTISATERVLTGSVDRTITAEQIEELANDLEACSLFVAGMVLTYILNKSPVATEQAKATAEHQWFDSCRDLDLLIAKYKERAKSRGSISPMSSGDSDPTKTA